ncbi:leucyl aminopeptidase [Sphingomonas rhizophila]|uniref:Probable cytosol aminopeptidase n=1 Tax=Sphingomonas rhizophila TaxID=2071607 RepID=A0A7G9SDP5_9SPHN|nr:leucyl aminopeptidase [Sphingomonas rhizophila]QNN65970.1 leucyl aminopeptidase [Sphingomonas rhizophila]
MQIRFATSRPAGDHVLVLPATGPSIVATGIDPNGLASILKRQRFEGDAGSVVEHFTTGDDARRLLIVGIGRADAAAAEQLGGAVAGRLLTSGEREAVIDLSGAGLDADSAARVALAAVLRSWRHDAYRTRLKDKQKPTLEQVTIVGAPDGAESLWGDRYSALADGLALTRKLVTEPPNIIYPESFVARCREPMEQAGLKVRALGQAEMEKLGMGALLGVSQGSRRAPQLLVMEWNGGTQGDKPLVFVGKGVTFDTGGISIKPAAGMEMMKWDMGGAGAVAGAMLAIARRKAPANVVGICGLVENMPDGNAQRPSDVVTTMSGQTVEVINTDAEGRLVLCDALTWAQKEYRPRAIVDLATLTGAMVISLGHEYAGFFTNDDKLAAQLTKAADETGDKLWRQPLGEAYDRLIDSPIADMKNVGPREAGSITAAQFLQRYIEDGVSWAHLDIAGMAWSDKPKPTYDKGATGYGVRLLDQLVADLA